MRPPPSPRRVALVSTPFVSVPPSGYGGTELIVAELALALAARGVEVVVYTTGDSTLAAPNIELRSYYAQAQWPPQRDIDHVHAMWSLRDAARDPRGFDVVHLHTSEALALTSLCPYPMLYTIHHASDPKLTALYRSAPHVSLVAISRNQARLEPAKVSAVVHHGLDPRRFRQMDDQGYLLFIGRYDRVKGAASAIEIATRAGLPLVMAGGPHDLPYFEAEVKPLIARHGVMDVGPVGAAKAGLIARARAVLFPIEWDEPFGLVMIEAMLAGVPVLATRRGSVPEVIEDGVTGVVANDLSELVAAARVAHEVFDRARIAARARARFSADRMTKNYLRLYAAAMLEPMLAAAEPESAAG